MLRILQDLRVDVRLHLALLLLLPSNLSVVRLHFEGGLRFQSGQTRTKADTIRLLPCLVRLLSMLRYSTVENLIELSLLLA